MVFVWYGVGQFDVVVVDVQQGQWGVVVFVDVQLQLEMIGLCVFDGVCCIFLYQVVDCCVCVVVEQLWVVVYVCYVYDVGCIEQVVDWVFFQCMEQVEFIQYCWVQVVQEVVQGVLYMFQDCVD